MKYIKTYIDYNSLHEYEDQLKMALKQSIQTYQTSFENSLKDVPLNNNYELLKYIYPKLNEFQKNIFIECITKDSAGLSLPLGSGKTLISLLLALYFTRDNLFPTLIVMSKSLVFSWINEINKFFGDKLKYEVINQPINKVKLWKIKPDTSIVLTTIDILSLCYKECNIKESFVNQIFTHKNNIYINKYCNPKKPFLNHVVGGGIFFSKDWGCLIVDEVQKYTNIETSRCQSLGSIFSTHRWVLSGTMFDEPKVNSILGYYVILNDKRKPRTVPDMKALLYDKKNKFEGLNKSLVSRSCNRAFKPPKVNEYIVKHKLDPEEEIVYMAMKKILMEVKKKADEAKLCDNTADLQKFTSYKLVMIIYLRQALISALVPLTSVAIDACDMKKKSELSKLIISEINRTGIKKWVDKEESVKSSRVRASIESMKKHPDERILIFSCFKTYLDILQHFITSGDDKTDRPIFRMMSSMSAKTRGELIKTFEKSQNGVLLLSYQLGAEGLNLQFTSTIFIIDFWWNAAKIQQAIGRIFRYGQVSDEINVYFFTANTGIEKILFEKQKAKLDIIEELKIGPIKTKVPKLKLDDIIKMIDLADNEKKLKDIKFY